MAYDETATKYKENHKMSDHVIKSSRAPFGIDQQPGRRAAATGEIIPASTNSSGIPIAAIQNLIPGQILSIINTCAEDIKIELQGQVRPIPSGEARPIGTFHPGHRILTIRTIRDGRQIGSIPTISLAIGYSEDESTIEGPPEAIGEWDDNQIKQIEIRSQAV
jgi:hypothetical protein